jgi:hypothetical protein
VTHNPNLTYLNMWVPNINPRPFDVIQQWHILKFFTVDTGQKTLDIIMLRHYWRTFSKDRVIISSSVYWYVNSCVLSIIFCDFNMQTDYGKFARIWTWGVDSLIIVTSLRLLLLAYLWCLMHIHKTLPSTP